MQQAESDRGDGPSSAPACKHPAHPLDVLCPRCGHTLINDPSPAQLRNAERLAKIRALLLPAAADKTTKRDWPDLAKSYAPVAVTLLVAIGGWWITSTHNAAQVELKNSEQQTARATAEANASLAYFQFLARDPLPTQDQQDQALVAVAAVLPPELAFSLAVKRLPTKSEATNLLIRTHGEMSWKYLSPFIEQTDDSPDRWHPRNDSQFEEGGPSAIPRNILELLHEQNLLQQELDYLLSAANVRPHRRMEALVSYFKFIRMLDSGYAESHTQSTKALVLRLLEDERFDVATKSDVATAAAFAFVDEPAYQPQWDLLGAAAATYWDKFDIERGEIPIEKSIRFRLLHDSIYFVDAGKYFLTEPARIASRVLADRLVSLELRDMGVEQTTSLLYTYAGYLPGRRHEITQYLSPSDIPRVALAVTLATDTPAERRALSGLLGSFGGKMIYENCATEKAMQRKYAELVIEWYEEHADGSWEAPTYFSQVSKDHPDLRTRIAAVMKKTGP